MFANLYFYFTFLLKIEFRCTLFPLIILEMFLLHWTWFGSPTDLLDRIVSRHRSVISAALSSTVTSIIRKWKRFGTIRTFPRVGSPAKLSDQGRKGLSQGGDQESDGHSDSAPALWRGDNLPEEKTSLQHSTNQACMAEWPDGSHSSVKGTWQPAWSLYSNVQRQSGWKPALERSGPQTKEVQLDKDPEHTAFITKEWRWDNSVNVQPGPALNTIEHLWRYLKMYVYWRPLLQAGADVCQACSIILKKT